MHKMFKASALNGKGIRESWEQCEICGASKHSGKWHLAGYRSKELPPCNEDFKEWQRGAELTPITDEI